MRAEKPSAGAPRRPVHEVVRVEQDETIIRIIRIIPPIIPLAFQPYLLVNFGSQRVVCAGMTLGARGSRAGRSALAKAASPNPRVILASIPGMDAGF